jgi:hypothetical protein
MYCECESYERYRTEEDEAEPVDDAVGSLEED